MISPAFHASGFTPQDKEIAETVSTHPAGKSRVMLPLSVFIIAYNEADRLPLVLDALGDLADDVVVVDFGLR